MTEHTDQNEPTSTPDEALSLQAVGRLLAEAREQAGLSVDEVAARLRLMPRQVEALESGNAEGLPGPAFVRGFLRNYAKLLQLDAEPLLEAIRAQVPEVSQHKISLHSENIPISRGERKAWAVYAMIAALLLAALAAWFAYTDIAGRGSGNHAPDIPPLPQAPQTPANAVPVVPAPAPAEAVPAAPVAPLPQPLESIPQPLESAPQAAVAAPQPAATARLTLVSNQSSWVSVRDRDGKELYSKTLPAGRQEVIEGQPPLSVVLGNATGMQATFNDKPVDLAPHTKANVARLTLE